MERVLTADEKIRRAEEIYARRNSQRARTTVAKVNVNEKRDFKLFKRIFLQVTICALIYIIFYLIHTTNYVFSDDVINKTKEILSYDINFNEIYTQISGIFNFVHSEEKTNVEENNIEPSNENNIENSEVSSDDVSNGEDKLEEGTLGVVDVKDDENKSTMTQEELDVQEIKQKCSFVQPLKGTITSEFGEREVTAKEVTPEHYGIDIAAKSGTKISSAMDGKVIVASSNSEYGNFIKILKDDVMTVYAHCKKLMVKEGDIVKKGDVIATVGSTGNSTGPHLHFEIRLSDRFVNPKSIIEF